MSQDTVNAIVTRARGISHRGEHFADGAVIENMPINQFDDWRGIGWVSLATPEQVEASRAKAVPEPDVPDAPAVSAKPKRAKPAASRKRASTPAKVKAPVAVPAQPAAVEAAPSETPPAEQAD